MTAREIDWKEPQIIINGVELTVGQAMTVRVACGAFAMGMGDAEIRLGLGEIGDAYQKRLREIHKLMARISP
jgi:hypothetical protein